MKKYSIFCSLLLAVNAFAGGSSVYQISANQIYNSYLANQLDANGKVITNVSSLNWTNSALRMTNAPKSFQWFSLAGKIREFSKGLAFNSFPSSIAAGPDRTLWFTELNVPGRIGRITPRPGR